MKKSLILFVVFTSIILQGLAQPITNIGAEAAGFSSERLKRIDNAMNEWVEKGWMNGGAALIIRDGKIAYYKAAGYNDLDAKTPYYSGGAGLSSTIYDYALFLQMLLNNGEYNGKRLLGRNTVRMMTMNQIGDLSLGDDKFGLGFQVVSEKGSGRSPAQEGTFSWGGAFATSY